MSSALSLAASLDPVIKMRHAGIDPYPWQVPVLRSTARRQIILATRQGGKALHVDTPICTPGGWTTMGRLGPGDQVFDEQGKPCFVLACSDIRERDVLSVRFSDGSGVVADREHLWLTIDAATRAAIGRHEGGVLPRDWPTYVAPGRNRVAAMVQLGQAPCAVEGCDRAMRRPASGLCGGHWQQQHRGAALTLLESPQPRTRVVTTATMAATQFRCSRGDVNHSIPATAPLVFPHRPLPVDPYVLGAWLGDGTSSGAIITVADSEIVDEIRRAGYLVVRNSARYRYAIRDLSSDLRRSGLLGNKHIPEVYLRASPAQRLALLQGLMDTDGSALSTDNSKCEFCTTNPRLAEGFRELAVGLGLIVKVAQSEAKLNGRVIGPRWRITFSPWFNPFRLPRKSARMRFDGPRKLVRRLRYVVGVEPAGRAAVRCIVVSSASRLFLAGRSLIPTHNSTVVAAKTLHVAETEPGSEIVIGAPKQDQAAEMLRKAMGIYNVGGHWVEAEVDKQSVLRVELSNGSRISAVPGAASTVRSFSALRLLVLDEAAYVDDEFYQAVFPMLAVSQGEVMLLSTPHAKAGAYWEVWENAPEWSDGLADQEQMEAWRRTLATWHDCPRITPEFIAAERGRFGDAYVAREYECQFAETAGSVFTSAEIDGMADVGVDTWSLW